jgi:hypothetical protein
LCRLFWLLSTSEGEVRLCGVTLHRISLLNLFNQMNLSKSFPVSRFCVLSNRTLLFVAWDSQTIHRASHTLTTLTLFMVSNAIVVVVSHWFSPPHVAYPTDYKASRKPFCRSDS